jgi:hypothetical protein
MFSSSLFVFLSPTLFLRLIAAHGSMIMPVSRNAIDRHEPGRFNATQAYDCNCGCCNEGCGGSKCTAAALASCEAPGFRANMSGQACLWFSQGCGIGCATCDNHTQHSNGAPFCTNQGERDSYRGSCRGIT